MEQQPRIVFLSLTNDLGTDRIVSHMGQDGAECAVVGASGSFAAKSRFARRYIRLPSFGGPWLAALMVRRRLEAVVADWHPDWVVPLDDMAAQLSRSLAVNLSVDLALRALLVRSLGAPEHYATVCSRHRLMEVAAELGIRTPAHRRAPDLAGALDAAVDCGYPVILKREQTCGGAGVSIADGPDSLRQAFRRGELKTLTKRPLQRLAGFGRTDAPAMTLQKFLTGTLAMRTLACREGRVLDGVSFMAERLHPAKVGASTVIRLVANSEMDVAARRLVAKLGCSGIVSFDFILDEQGSASLIEMNPRPIGSGHLGGLFGHDIYAALLADIGGQPAKRRTALATPSQAIALFPKELNRDPSGSGLDPAMLHDVPWDEPDVVQAYLNQLTDDHPDYKDSLAGLLLGPAEADPQDTVRHSLVL